ncbi:metallophosphoesterase [Shimazuella sp. AN120528]|uniref:metallophosphoesterase n=1 Tax=Shimazuella soli TaxID=1892854 RepID=UPI001F0FE145|nr:metallophosphoesterase [Shimazuella soli]MCH5585619.1 metallophosphoesterase [Shimazuella soli]
MNLKPTINATKNHKINRRDFIKRSFYYIAGIIGIPTLTGAYSRWVEPYQLETTKIDITLPYLPASFHNFTICHFSDLHLGFHLEIDDLSPLIYAIQNEVPDCICFTGDLFDKAPSKTKKTAKLLSQLEAPYGKYAVLGNHDNWSNQLSVKRVLKKAGFELLLNEHISLNRHTDNLYIAGIDDPWVGEADIRKALGGIPKDACTILLSHEPDFADEFYRYPIDLQLSGHSHGGQIRIPLVGALYTPPYSNKYPYGLNRVKGSHYQVYTTRGIGMTRMPVRFHCKPELTIITLKCVD